jgi:hypothetical protein
MWAYQRNGDWQFNVRVCGPQDSRHVGRGGVLYESAGHADARAAKLAAEDWLRQFGHAILAAMGPDDFDLMVSALVVAGRGLDAAACEVASLISDRRGLVEAVKEGRPYGTYPVTERYVGPASSAVYQAECAIKALIGDESARASVGAQLRP